MKININSPAKRAAEEEAKRKAEEEARRLEEEHKAEEERKQKEEEMKRQLEQQVRAEAEEREKKEKLRREAREKARQDREEELKAIEEAERIKREEEEENKKQGKGKRRKGDKTKIVESTNPATNADYYRNYQARIRNNRAKKVLFNFSFYFIIIFLVCFNIYFAFFHQLRPMPEIAQEVRNINKDSNYPVEGVENYLNNHLKEILNTEVKASTGTGTKEWEISDILIRRVETHGDSNADIYFAAEISTNIESSYHNFILGLGYNFDTKRYTPTSNLITRAEGEQDNVELYKEASLWEFGTAAQMSEEDTEALTSFLNSFFTLVYNEHKSVDSMLVEGYSPTKLGDDNFHFEKINELEYYSETNPMGANVHINYNVTSTEGLSYTIDTYMTVQHASNVFLIQKIY